MVGLRKVSVGDFVDVGEDIVNLEQIDPLKVDFRVAEIYLGAVRPGQPIELAVDAFPGETFAGEVYAIDPLIDESGRSIVLRARLPNRTRPPAAGPVRPRHAGAERARGRAPGARAGAGAAGPGPVRVQGGRRQGGADQGRPSAIRREGMVEIVEGLGPDDEVVTAGQLKIRDGAPVQPAAGRRRPEPMFLPELSIRRPVLATVMTLVVVLVGIIAYERLTVREYPNIDEPVVTVETTFPGASAEIIESQVTQPLEESLAGIEGIDFMSSISRPEQSQITVRFRLDRDPDAAANDVRDRVARVRGRLPDEIDEPIVSKVEADAQPIIYLAFSSDRHSPLEVTDFADRFVKDRLQNLPGVADVRIFGERRYAMRIWLDRGAARRLPPDAAGRRGRAAPAERRDAGRPHRERGARVHRALRDRPAHAGAVRAHRAARGRRLSGAPRRRRRAPSSGPRTSASTSASTAASAVALGVVKQATANPLDVSEAVRAELPAIQQDLPGGHAAPTSPTTPRSSSAIDRRGVRRPSARRSCWWCW